MSSGKLSSGKFAFFAAEKSRERLIGDALRAGAHKVGYTFETISSSKWHPDLASNYDVLLTWGVKGRSRAIMDTCSYLNRPFIYLDKGFISRLTHLKVSVGGFQPSRITCKYDDKRLLDWDGYDHWSKNPTIRPSMRSSVVVWAGPSQKYTKFHGLSHPTVLAEEFVYNLRRINNTLIPAYMPKASWRDAVPISGVLDTDRFWSEQHSGALVTHGSNSSIGYLLRGIPIIVTGSGALGGVVPDSLEILRSPADYELDLQKVMERLKVLSYSQWTLSELEGVGFWHIFTQQICNVYPNFNPCHISVGPLGGKYE